MKPYIKLLLSLFCALSVINFSYTVSASETETTVTVFSDTYTGLFDGNAPKGIPSGDGSFSYSDEQISFSIAGHWKDNMLSGKATIQYSDNTKIETTYKNGFMNGKTKQYRADGSYTSFKCIDGHPYGLLTEFNPEGSKVGFDYYFQTQPIKQLKEQSQKFDYTALMSMEPRLDPLKVRGTVVNVYETKTHAFVLLKDKQSHYYVLTYPNSTTDKYNQALAPNMVPGDTVIAYGFLQKVDSLNNIENLGSSLLVTDWNQSLHTTADDSTEVDEEIESNLVDEIEQSLSLDTSSNNSNSTKKAAKPNPDFENTLPFLTIFAAELNNQPAFDRFNASYDYSDILTNPYYYSDLSADLTGTVKKIYVDYGKKRAYIYLTETDTANEYFIRYEFKEADTLPGISNIIHVNGTFKGNAKRSITTESMPQNQDTETIQYVIYPRVHTKTLEIIQ